VESYVAHRRDTTSTHLVIDPARGHVEAASFPFREAGAEGGGQHRPDIGRRGARSGRGRCAACSPEMHPELVGGAALPHEHHLRRVDRERVFKIARPLRLPLQSGQTPNPELLVLARPRPPLQHMHPPEHITHWILYPSCQLTQTCTI
jgi:hypothetical protein